MEYLPILRYLLAFAFLTALGAPVAALVFRELPRRGAAFALPTALIPFAIVVFWVGQLRFGRPTILLGAGTIAVGAAAAYSRGARVNWRAVAAGYGVFAVGFSFLVLLRTSSPGVTPAGGEQFLHFGLVNALARAPSLPPEDFWFAGEPLKYYYGTQLQVTSFAMLAGVELRYGFNLGIAAFYGVLFVVAYGLAGAIVAGRGYSYRLGGALGAAFVALGGPTTTPIRFLTPHLPERLSEAVAPAAFGFVADRFKGGDLSATVTDLSDPLDWGWWYTRYVVVGTIQEVPLYSFVKADLHGHALSTGFVLFAGAVAYAYYTTPAEARLRRLAILFGGLGAIAGVFGFMNTWSLPTAGGLALLAVGAADAHPATLLPERYRSHVEPGTDRGDGRVAWAARELWRLALAGVAAVAVVLIGVAIASPFLLFGHVPTNEGVGFFPPRSLLGPFLVVYVGLLSVVATYLATRGRPAIRGVERRALATAAGALLLAIVVATAFLDAGVLAVTGSLVVAAWLLVRTGRGDFAVVLMVAGVGLLLSLELVHARLPLIDYPRWNTSLKVAVQGWTLGAAGAGAGAALLLGRARDRLVASRSDASSTDGELSPEPATLGTSAAVIVVVVALLASLVFPAMVVARGVGEDVVEDEFEPSIDALSNLERWHADEAAAIGWLGNRTGTPTVVEAPGPSYRFTSPASTFTGLPTVVGWDHQEEYRSVEAYERRVAHVDAIYAGEWADAGSHLDRYDVEYVYVGPNERERYGSELRSFDRSAFTLVFDNDDVTIYAVNESALGE